MSDNEIDVAVRSIPRGRWAVGVSGGADSVALLAALRMRSELHLHVVHLDHQTRGADSTADAEFVQSLCRCWSLPCTLARRDEIEPLVQNPPANLSARFRALRLALFRRTVATHQLDGVILAHHADDQAETILHRLLRGSGYAGLAAMQPRAEVAGLVILRPLLHVRRAALREVLMASGLSWREDASNRSKKYFRNRLRAILSECPQFSIELLRLGEACTELRDWSRSTAPRLPESFAAATLARLPELLAEESARRWLLDRGMPPELLDPSTIHRVIEMSCDAASPARQDLPGGIRMRRRAGIITAMPAERSAR